MLWMYAQRRIVRHCADHQIPPSASLLATNAALQCRRRVSPDTDQAQIVALEVCALIRVPRVNGR